MAAGEECKGHLDRSVVMAKLQTGPRALDPKLRSVLSRLETARKRSRRQEFPHLALSLL